MPCLHKDISSYYMGIDGGIYPYIFPRYPYRSPSKYLFKNKKWTYEPKLPLWWSFIMTSSHRCQHLVCRLTHFPKISIVKGLHLFLTPIRVFIYLGDILVKSSWTSDVECILPLLHIFMPSSFLFTLHSQELPNQSSSIVVSFLMIHMRTYYVDFI